ncbi:tetratricopeptide repeat protein [Nibricoccus aquaticus]|nr:tetratricopeptide repeat protein [Nibricoccus aquaticus]
MLRYFPGRSGRFPSTWLASLAVIIAFTGLPLAAQPIWLRLQCADFSIYTDGSQRDLESVAVTYAAFRQLSRDLLLRPETKVPPSTIILFRRLDSLKKHSAPIQNSDLTIAAFSTEVDSRILTALCVAGDRKNAQATLFEFETIWTLGRSGYLLPTWIAQGAGQVLSSLEIDKSNAILGRDSGRFDHRLSIPWKRFLEINEASPEYKGDDDPGAFHGQAWSLMHWVLLNQDNTQERFQRVSKEHSLLQHGKEVASVLDVPLATLNREVNKHFRGRLKTRAFPFDEKALRAGWTISPAPLAEVMINCADLLASAQKPAEARAELAQAVALAPEEPEVHEAIARLALRENDQETAIAHYRRAIELGSKNPMSRLRSATARLDESSTNGTDLPGNAGNNAAEAIAEIREVIALEPQNLHAYRLLGRALFLAPKLAEKDLDELTPGLVPGDAGSHVRYYRALLYARLNIFDRATDDLNTIVADPSVSANERRAAKSLLARLPKPSAQR